MKYFKQFNVEEYEKLSNHDKFVQLDNFDVQDSCQSESSESNNVEKETNSMDGNDNQVSSKILISCLRILMIIIATIHTGLKPNRENTYDATQFDSGSGLAPNQQFRG